MNDQDFTSPWAILPPPVRYDPKLPPSAKLLFAEIAAKTNTMGYCWAHNDYFARVLGLTADSVVRLIRALEAAGFILIDYDETRPNADKRHIYLTPSSLLPFGGGIFATPRGGKNAGTPLLNENNKKENRPARPKYMGLDVYKEICAWCGEDGELLLAWLQYADMRQRTRHPVATVATVTRACKKLEELSGGRRAGKLGLLHKATDASWRGFYPLNPGDEGYADPAANERRPETWN